MTSNRNALMKIPDLETHNPDSLHLLKLATVRPTRDLIWMAGMKAAFATPKPSRLSGFKAWLRRHVWGFKAWQLGRAYHAPRWTCTKVILRSIFK